MVEKVEGALQWVFVRRVGAAASWGDAYDITGSE